MHYFNEFFKFTNDEFIVYRLKMQFVTKYVISSYKCFAPIILNLFPFLEPTIVDTQHFCIFHFYLMSQFAELRRYFSAKIKFTYLSHPVASCTNTV